MAEDTRRNPSSQPRLFLLTHSHSRSDLLSRRGQASLEMTLALIGALLLLFGSLKVFLWVNERMVSRQLSYEATRTAAGNHASPGTAWVEPQKRLNIFQ